MLDCISSKCQQQHGAADLSAEAACYGKSEASDGLMHHEVKVTDVGTMRPFIKTL